MDKILMITAASILALFIGRAAAAAPPQDVIPTASGELVVTFVGHGTLVLSFGGKVVHVDPWSNLADYSALPKADLILITHDHRDHLDPSAVAAVRKDGTVILGSAAAAAQLPGAFFLANGETRTAVGFLVEAVPAYNVVHTRSEGVPFHPRGAGNGYVVTFADKRIYIAGDTENIPEMKALGRIDVAFLPVNLPYTMTPSMLADAARMVRPAILYPYHTGDTDTAKILESLGSIPGTEVRIRPMK